MMPPKAKIFCGVRFGSGLHHEYQSLKGTQALFLGQHFQPLNHLPPHWSHSALGQLVSTGLQHILDSLEDSCFALCPHPHHPTSSHRSRTGTVLYHPPDGRHQCSARVTLMCTTALHFVLLLNLSEHPESDLPG